MKVLFATDGSEYSEIAARFLTGVNWTRDDAITVFHAVYAVPFHDDWKFYAETLQAVKKELAPRILDSTLAILKPVSASLSVEISEFSPGQCTPDQCIMQAANASGADLIVMGARGIKGVTSAFLGSVTRLVAIHATKPVLVVKPASGRKAENVKILFAADGSDSSRAAAGLLASLPFADNAEVTIANVISSSFSDIPERFALEVNDRIKDTVAGARTREFSASEKIVEEAKEQLSARFRKISVLSMVGDPPGEIMKTGEAIAADIIAVGCRGLTGMRGMMGSVSRNILSHAPCSVLIGKTCGS